MSMTAAVQQLCQTVPAGNQLPVESRRLLTAAVERCSLGARGSLFAATQHCCRECRRLVISCWHRPHCSQPLELRTADSGQGLQLELFVALP